MRFRSCQQRRSPRNSTSWRPVVGVISKPPSPAPQRDPCSGCRGGLLQAKTTRAAPTPPRSALASSTSSPSASSSSPPPPLPARVYLQVTPLEGLSFLAPGPAQLSPHAVVVLETFSHESSRTEEGRQQQPKNSQVFAFDFLPREPQRLTTALALFSGRPVEAIGRERRLSRVPRRRCVLVCEGLRGGEGREEEEEKEASGGDGSSSSGSGTSLLAVARARCRAWEQTPLVWLRYDCTHAAVELAAELAGVERAAARRALERACSS